MPSTLEALAIALAFLAPGLSFEQGIERRVGYWRTNLADRTLRFFLISTLLQVLFFPFTFSVWATEFRGVDWSTMSTPPWIAWIAMLAYIIVPFLAGTYVGHRAAHGDGWVRFVVGSSPAPRAWDELFCGQRGHGYIRARFKSDHRWVAGVWGYASSFPNSEDLLLSYQLECDPVSGELVLDDDGSPRPVQWALLIQREDVDDLQFQPFPDQEG